MPFSATAEGSVSAGTCSVTKDCQAGPNSAMPLPTTKQNASRICGVTISNHANTVSVVAPDSAITSDTSATMRRSYMSAMAPAGIEISITGSISAVCTSATLSADDVIWVIAQAAPTAWINRPRLESRLASQIRRNVACRSGAATPSADKIEPFGGRLMACSVDAADGRRDFLTIRSDARESEWLSSGWAADSGGGGGGQKTQKCRGVPKK